MARTRPCGHCDGEDGPAVARVRIRDWDDSTFDVDVCKQCREDERADTVKVLKTYPKGRFVPSRTPAGS